MTVRRRHVGWIAPGWPAGHTLIELLIVVAMLGITSFGAYAFWSQGVRQTRQIAHRAMATDAALNAWETLQAGYPLARDGRPNELPPAVADVSGLHGGRCEYVRLPSPHGPVDDVTLGIAWDDDGTTRVFSLHGQLPREHPAP